MVLKQLGSKNGHPLIECDGKKIAVGDFLKMSDRADRPPFYGVVTEIVVFRNGRKIRSCNILLEDEAKLRSHLISLGPNCVLADSITVLTASQLVNEINDLQKRCFDALMVVA
ncbi:MAG: hypothetical protein HYW15_01390 [Candidatus Giovannonibacteria bacterium]|nr:MAG: hypothetical protein HYW15_01390 [Candidatus Giovannonibacteria bacterium]